MDKANSITLDLIAKSKSGELDWKKSTYRHVEYYRTTFRGIQFRLKGSLLTAKNSGVAVEIAHPPLSTELFEILNEQHQIKSQKLFYLKKMKN